MSSEGPNNIEPGEDKRDVQKNKGPNKIPGTAVFRSPYSVASKTAGCSPYYMGSGVTNASDEEKRRIMHNENERKRKEKLNKWIVRLCTLVPDCNGKNLSKNCILEKTVEFIKKLTKQQKLPDDVQALKDEVIRLTEKVELLSSENTQYLSLLKEAQNLSRGAWSLNMSIQKRQSTDSSETEDSGITMTPTADKVNLASSGMCKTSSTPCLPSLLQAPTQNVLAVPIVAAGTQQIVQPLSTGAPLLLSGLNSHTYDEKVIKTQPKASVVAAIPSAPMVNPAATNKVAAVLQNGQTFVANTQPFIANIRPAEEEKQAVHQNGHSIQALLSSSNIVSSTSESKAVYSIPTYLQAVHNTDGAAGNVFVAPNAPLVAAQPQTPVVVQGENGPVVIMHPGTTPYFAVPLNTMSAHHNMCEPTASFKSPIVLTQFPSLLNITEQSISPKAAQTQPPAVQIAPVLQGTQCQQSLLVGTQPVIGALNSSAPVLSTGQAIQLQTAPVAQTVQLQARNGQAVQLQQADTNGHPTPTVLGIPNNPTATVMAQQLVQVPTSENGSSTATAVLIPQQSANSSAQQCIIPVGQVAFSTVSASPTVVTVAPITQTTRNLTDFSISETFHGVPRSENGAKEDDSSEILVDEGDIYLTRTTDTSFSSDCLTPPYSSPNLLLSQASNECVLSPDVSVEQSDAKPLSHSIASLTGLNN